ncbi:hypothetical protein K469DRAFT_225788 [Zopfia rhizophila CBS 207.26]|uniref:Uncharacterized protein n=1 Tax=Zopfia rhizophila CBS 207.26 TaxID=1314779 RepID=A0A6A6DY55_9PEZI|nr:hypothetical protein K469DRAFT_225788 [Zopfia rhizophila CBS 207.26]
MCGLWRSTSKHFMRAAQVCFASLCTGGALSATCTHHDSLGAGYFFFCVLTGSLVRGWDRASFYFFCAGWLFGMQSPLLPSALQVCWKLKVPIREDTFGVRVSCSYMIGGPIPAPIN